MIGEWLALPLLREAGSKRPGDAIYDDILYPIANRLAKQLELANACLLRRRHPAVCKELRTKRSEALAKKMANLVCALETALQETTSRSVKQIAKDLGIREEVISRHFPELKRQLRIKYLSWRATARREEQKRIEATVKKTVQGIRSCGEYPSAGRVLDREPRLRSAGWEKLQRAIQKACNE